MSAAAGAPGSLSAAAAAERSRRYCEQVTRAAATNFYWGIRVLSPAKRGAMCAIYAYARRVDDIGDGELPIAEKRRQLAGVRASVARLETATGDEVMAALADACARFALPRQSLLDLIDGVEMDVDGVTYETLDELVGYCRRVAGSIGRLCLAVFGCADAVHGGDLADDLGVAMQLTNILRDIREDALNARVYLPIDDLRRFGWYGAEASVPPADAQASLPPAGAEASAALAGVRALLDAAAADGGDPRAAPLVRFEAARARAWFERGLHLVDLLDRRSAACVLAMSGIYQGLLARIDERPERVMRERVSLSTPQKLYIAARGVLEARR